MAQTVSVEKYHAALDMIITLARDIVPLRRLVFAARRVAFEDQGPEAIKELDAASEAFANVFLGRTNRKHTVKERYPMNKRGEMLSKMISLATERHVGQFDKGGRPYILHPLTVMHRLRTDDEELQCIAVGHDLLEDTPTTARELGDMGFGDRVVLGIHDLTKYEGLSERDYRDKLKANPDAVRVKIEDLRHNSDICRLKGVTEKDVARMVRYHEFYLELLAVQAAQR